MKKTISFMLIVALLFALASCMPNNANNVGDNIPPSTEDIMQTQDSKRRNNETRVFMRANWPGYASIDALASAATRYIVKVRVIDEREELINHSLELSMPSYSINTIHRLKVLEVFQGNTQTGDIIEVAQMGKQGFTSHDFVPLIVDDVLIMFLGGVNPEEYKDFPDAKFAVITNPTQGIYRIPSTSGGVSILAQNDDIVLESVNPDNNLVLTMGDLSRIAQANQR